MELNKLNYILGADYCGGSFSRWNDLRGSS